jgi:hypothetical protein
LKLYSYRYWNGAYEIIFQNRCVFIKRCSSTEALQNVEQLNSKIGNNQVSSAALSSLASQRYIRDLNYQMAGKLSD